ncbi:MAG: pyridoxal phosphate-dependent aminotransferase family protein [Actinomycetota bacterium]
MIDLTSSLYLGMRHGGERVPPWAELTTGRPAALAEAPAAREVGSRVAGLIGTTAATVAPSTLHAFWDLFVAMGARTILVDEGTYPIASWGAERARCAGAKVRRFRHHDPASLRRALAEAGDPRSVFVLTDGLCPGCGGVAPVGDYLAVARFQPGTVVVDDTQALGILGTPAPGHPYGRGGGGVARWTGVGDAGLIVVASLAKGLGVPVAAVAGSRAAVRRYESRSATRVHCSPASNAHLNAAVRALGANARVGDALRRRLARLVTRFRAGASALGVPLSEGLFPLQSVRSEPGLDPQATHRGLLELGVRTVLHRPRCGRGLAVSFIVTAGHREAEIDRTVEALGIVVASGGRARPRAGRTAQPRARRRAVAG